MYGKTYSQMVSDLDENGTLGGMIPKFISEKPENSLLTNYFLPKFYKLSPSRQSGMGLGYIPLSEIINYGSVLGINDLEQFIDVMQAADNEYVKLNNKKDDEK